MKTEGSFFVRGREAAEVGRRREEKGGVNTSKVQQYEWNPLFDVLTRKTKNKLSELLLG